MKNKSLAYFSLLLLMVVFVNTNSGCYYDKESLVYPSTGGSSCDTTNITLSGDLNTILTASCFSCHSGTANLGGGIQLDQYTVIKAYADNGQLLSAITQDGSVPPMPQSGGKLSDCNINKFRAWINSGTPNN